RTTSTNRLHRSGRSGRDDGQKNFARRDKDRARQAPLQTKIPRLLSAVSVPRRAAPCLERPAPTQPQLLFWARRITRRATRRAQRGPSQAAASGRLRGRWGRQDRNRDGVRIPLRGGVRSGVVAALGGVGGVGCR